MTLSEVEAALCAKRVTLVDRVTIKHDQTGVFAWYKSVRICRLDIAVPNLVRLERDFGLIVLTPENVVDVFRAALADSHSFIHREYLDSLEISIHF